MKGSEAGCKCAFRFKIDMSALNKTLRDPVGFRCNVTSPHHRTGTKYKARTPLSRADPLGRTPLGRARGALERYAARVLCTAAEPRRAATQSQSAGWECTLPVCA